METNQPNNKDKSILYIDKTILILCILALGACAFTMMTVESYQEKINQEWISQWEMSGCKVDPIPVNVSFNIWRDYDGRN